MGDEYSGILDWEDQPKSQLVVHFLRLLPSKALFDFTSVSPEGHWRVQGSATTKDGKEFQSESLTAFDIGQKSEPLRITFETIRLSDDGSVCDVRGRWNDSTGTGVFLGDLDRK